MGQENFRWIKCIWIDESNGLAVLRTTNMGRSRAPSFLGCLLGRVLGGGEISARVIRSSSMASALCGGWPCYVGTLVPHTKNPVRSIPISVQNQR
jgi:hypothetical protein